MTSREYPDRPLVGVGAVILHGEGQDTRVLLARRGRAPSLDEWSIPGGLIKVGETLRQAVAREVEEETGLRVHASTLLELVDHIIHESEEVGDTPDQQESVKSSDCRIKYHYVIADYLCELEGGQRPMSARPSSDAAELRWCLRSELAQFNLQPALLQILEKCFQKRV